MSLLRETITLLSNGTIRTLDPVEGVTHAVAYREGRVIATGEDALAMRGRSSEFDLRGRKLPDGTVVTTNEQVRNYLLHAAGMAVVPFQAFGMRAETGWMRLSVGAVSLADITALLPRLREALTAVS